MPQNSKNLWWVSLADLDNGTCLGAVITEQVTMDDAARYAARLVGRPAEDLHILVFPVNPEGYPEEYRDRLLEKEEALNAGAGSRPVSLALREDGTYGLSS